jgi:hypothetical protein
MLIPTRFSAIENFGSSLTTAPSLCKEEILRCGQRLMPTCGRTGVRFSGLECVNIQMRGTQQQTTRSIRPKLSRLSLRLRPKLSRLSPRLRPKLNKP